MKISILIPNYNKAKYVIECLHSCLNQSYKNIEVIFIDNESSDNSLEIVKKYKEETNTKFIIDVAKNIYPQCWDECLELAEDKYISGDYYTIIGSDDVIHEKYIENAVELISTKKPLFFQSSLVWFSEGETIREACYNYKDINDFKKQLLTSCCVNTPTVFYKKDFKKHLLINTEPTKYSGAADYALYCEIANKNILIENCQKWIGYYYRINPDQATWNMHKSKINYDKLIQKKWKEKWTN
jgi:glycosyltransferase involved in cell wall biosynthesis